MNTLVIRGKRYTFEPRDDFGWTEDSHPHKITIDGQDFGEIRHDQIPAFCLEMKQLLDKFDFEKQ